MKQVKLVSLAVLATLLVILVFQNTEAVETKVLFATVTMPRALLLFVTAAVGFAMGVLVALFWMRRPGVRQSE